MKSSSMIFLLMMQAFVTVSFVCPQVLIPPLHEAVLQKKVMKVKELLLKGCNVNEQIKHGIRQDLGATPLHLVIRYPEYVGQEALSRKDIAIIYLLIRFGARLTEQTDVLKDTPMHLAIRMKNHFFVCLLKLFSCMFKRDLGEDIENSDHQTALELCHDIHNNVVRLSRLNFNIDEGHLRSVAESMKLIRKYLLDLSVYELSTQEQYCIVREFLAEYSFLLVDELKAHL